MKVWRLAALLVPVAWLALAGAALVRSSHREPAPAEGETDERGEAAVARDLDDAPAVRRLLRVLFPPPAGVGIGAVEGVRATIDGERLTGWMIAVEERGSGRTTGADAIEVAPEHEAAVRDLYVMVDERHDRLSGRGLVTVGEATLDEAAFLPLAGAWERWAGRHRWPHRLEVSLREVWLPGGAPDQLAVVVDDGRSRLAGLARVDLERATFEYVGDWTRTVLEEGGPLLTFAPPFRHRAVSVLIVAQHTGGGRSVGRCSIGEAFGGGRIRLLASDSDDTAGLADVRWEWRR